MLHSCHRRGKIDHFFSAKGLLLPGNELSPAKDVVLLCPDKLPGVFIVVNILFTACAVIEHGIDQHLAFQGDLSLIPVVKRETRGQPSAGAFALNDDVVPVHVQLIRVFIDIEQSRIGFLKLHGVFVRGIDRKRIVKGNDRGMAGIGYALNFRFQHGGIAAVIAPAVDEINDR